MGETFIITFFNLGKWKQVVLKRQIKTSGSLDLIEKLLSNPYFMLNFVANPYQWKNYIAKLVLIITGWMYKTWEIILFLLSIDASHGLGLIKRMDYLFFRHLKWWHFQRYFILFKRGHQPVKWPQVGVSRIISGLKGSLWQSRRREKDLWVLRGCQRLNGSKLLSHGRKCCLQQGKWQQCLLIPDWTQFIDHFMIFSHFPLIFKSFIEYL